MCDTILHEILYLLGDEWLRKKRPRRQEKKNTRNPLNICEKAPKRNEHSPVSGFGEDVCNDFLNSAIHRWTL
jgi:hypothetical protein